MRKSAAVLAACLLGWLITPAGRADDWPCWRGPNRDGVSRETGWLEQWPKEGPPVAWKAAVGTGFSSIAVRDGRLFTLGNQDNIDTVWCFEAASGKKLWNHSYEAPLDDKLFEGGPTATPAADRDCVYTLGRWGDLFCFEAATGKIVWSKNVHQQTGIRIPGWGYAGSPLVHEELLLLNIGGAGLAVARRTGKVLWSSADKDAGYSSPVPFRQGADQLAVFSADDGYVAVNLKTGKPVWQVRWLTRYGLNGADPIVAGDRVFVSSGYGKGAGLWKTGAGEPVELWRQRDLRNQFSSSVLLDGFLYGIDGDTNTRTALKCLELKTGTVRWTHAGVGCGSLMAADGKLLVLSETGELAVAPASPERFQPRSRVKVLDGKCWTVPVLANGRIYCRNARGDLVCLDVRKK